MRALVRPLLLFCASEVASATKVVASACASCSTTSAFKLSRRALGVSALVSSYNAEAALGGDNQLKSSNRPAATAVSMPAAS
jgi:hypothetical protein